MPTTNQNNSITNINKNSTPANVKIYKKHKNIKIYEETCVNYHKHKPMLPKPVKACLGLFTIDNNIVNKIAVAEVTVVVA